MRQRLLLVQFNRLVGGATSVACGRRGMLPTRRSQGRGYVYDDEQDPYQMHNLVDLPEARDLQSQMDALLNAKLKEAGDEFKPADYYIEKWGYKGKLNAVEGRCRLP